MRRTILCTVLTMSALSPATQAQSLWSGRSELGVVFARGNSHTETANTKFEVARERGNWKHSFGGAALGASDGESTTAERYEARLQADHRFSERSFWFGALRYESDRFSGFQYQATATAGAGHKFIDTETTKLDAQVGIGYRRLQLTTVAEPERHPVARGDAKFQHSLTPTTRIIERFLVEAGEENAFLQNELSIEVKMSQALALAVGVAVRHNTQPPLDLEQTDTVSTVNLVYAFE